MTYYSDLKTTQGFKTHFEDEKQEPDLSSVWVLCEPLHRKWLNQHGSFSLAEREWGEMQILHVWGVMQWKISYKNIIFNAISYSVVCPV